MPKITMPPAALEAGARAILKTWHGHPWELADTFHKDASMVEARAAFTAMVEAWPGMHQFAFSDNRGTFPALILPLTETSTKENDNG